MSKHDRTGMMEVKELIQQAENIGVEMMKEVVLRKKHKTLEWDVCSQEQRIIFCYSH